MALACCDKVIKDGDDNLVRWDIWGGGSGRVVLLLNIFNWRHGMALGVRVCISILAIYRYAWPGVLFFLSCIAESGSLHGELGILDLTWRVTGLDLMV